MQNRIWLSFDYDIDTKKFAVPIIKEINGTLLIYIIYLNHDDKSQSLKTDDIKIVKAGLRVIATCCTFRRMQKNRTMNKTDRVHRKSYVVRIYKHAFIGTK